VLISSPGRNKGEPEMVTAMFEAGLDCFHLKKPKYSNEQIIEYLNRIPIEFHPKIFLHSNYRLAIKFKVAGIHLNKKSNKPNWYRKLRVYYVKFRRKDIKVSASYSKLSNLHFDPPIYDHAFLSPIFESISEGNYQPAFQERGLMEALSRSKNPIVALGGVEMDKIEKVIDLGFDGLALLGVVWNDSHPLLAFKEIKERVQKHLKELEKR
jgi:thiamine-phosphate pyrophosphorylase